MPRSFTAQTSISDSLAKLYAGMIATTAPAHCAAGLNTTRQDVLVTPTADDSEDFSLFITQFDVTVEYTITSDSDATAAEIVDALVAAVNGGSQAVTAVDNGNTLSLVADHYAPEYAFTVTSAAGGTGALALSTVSEQSQTIADGSLVVFDATVSSRPMAVRLPTTSDEVTTFTGVAGITLADSLTSVRTADGAVSPGMVGIMRKGHVAVKVEEAVSANAPVYVRYAAGGNGRGSFGAGVGTSERALLNGAVYRTAASANGFAIVEINIIGG